MLFTPQTYKTTKHAVPPIH